MTDRIVCASGVELLMDALRRCLHVANEAGAFAVEVMAIDAQAKNFYLKYGFTPLIDHEWHLYLPMETIARELD